MSRPETLGPSAWAFSLGQRTVLGFGAVVAWMVLFHLLVNAWLLCVFTSLLLVLGGWLGSQAVLDSSSVVHLERFVTMERTPDPPDSELQLDREIHNTVCKIVRDFVSSWYRTVSSEPEFETQVRDAMVAMAMELKARAGRVDRRALTERLLHLCGCHLQSYLRVREMLAERGGRGEQGEQGERLWKLYRGVNAPHPAMKSPATEMAYARGVVDLLLHVLVPPPHLETRTGRFVVGELITCNVLLPLLSRLADPDWLNMLIVDIFTKSSRQAGETRDAAETPPTTSPAPQQPEAPHAPDALTLRVQPDTPGVTGASTPELCAYDVIDSAEMFCLQNMEEEESWPEGGARQRPSVSPMDYLRPEKFNPFYQETDSDMESPSFDFKRTSMESLVLIGSEEALLDRRDCSTPTDISSVVDVEDELQGLAALADRGGPQLLVSDGLEGALEGGGERPSSLGPVGPAGPELERDRVNPNELSISVPLQASSPTTGGAPLSPFSFEPLISPEGPVIIQNLRITGTITAKEHRGTGSHPYTLYTVKYETAVDSGSAGTLQPVAYHMVNRRYSEFLNLQTRLEEKPELRKILKNVKGPKKIFPDLPFGNMDSEKVEARKSLLETFLKQLCAIPETANSEEMQEFLALNTDARIAFVKKPFIVSRIDKIVVNAIVDTLKTAFPRSEPQSPTDEIDGDSEPKMQSDTKKSRSRLRFSSKIAPVLSVSDMQPKVTYCCDEERTVFNGLSLSGLEAFIKEQEKLVSGTAVREADGWKDCHLQEKVGTVCCGGPEKHPQGVLSQAAGKEPVAETALADVALDMLCLLIQDQWSWLCTENIQRTVRLLFGTLIDRWLDVGVANLTCRQYWVVYLRVLQEAVWPGGVLPAQPRPERSHAQREETRQQSLHCLMKLLPDVISDMLGSDRYRQSWQTALQSLQDPHINRHLVYCVCDLLLEFLIPESSAVDFQRALLSSLTGSTEKMPA
ncbi:sorting nexin-19-like [Megalops cyprinoides]|uniref:sorting nexin-19-like n=1 Tax=Megalops cyprinoides TaxID=118141 RepID=UPI001864D668|nr:sorting nexin-19-like [Megalops cyprinoides]